MCGFVAVIAPQGLEAEVLDQMRDRLAHRGPDGARSWLTSTPRAVVGLGHRRLSIIDLSQAADQPMFDRSGSLALVYNGEIYNYVELREELAAAGRVFSTRSDTEVLLAAYEQWGFECLPRLNGMFAFALWDGRRGELFVARDRFGEKPLFYTRLPGGGHAFASEMKALFAHPAVRTSPHESAVRDYIAGSFTRTSRRRCSRASSAYCRRTRWSSRTRLDPPAVALLDARLHRRGAGLSRGRGRGALPRSARAERPHPVALGRPGGHEPLRRSRLVHDRLHADGSSNAHPDADPEHVLGALRRPGPHRVGGAVHRSRGRATGVTRTASLQPPAGSSKNRSGFTGTRKSRSSPHRSTCSGA